MDALVIGLWTLSGLLAFIVGVRLERRFGPGRPVDPPARFEVEVDVVAPPKTERVHLVVAGNRQQYESWMRKGGLKPEEKGYKYVSRWEDVMGYRADDVVVVRVGTYWDNPVDVDLRKYFQL